MFIRRDNGHRKCVYRAGYCKYWKKCVETWDIRKFGNERLQILYENYLKEKEKEREKEQEIKETKIKKYRKLSGFSESNQK